MKPGASIVVAWMLFVPMFSGYAGDADSVILGGAANEVGGDGSDGSVQKGIAAFYHADLQGRRTASGEPYDPKAMTAAHRTLPFGTQVKVTNIANNRSVLVRVNDRGPMQPNRIIDVSRRAAQELGFFAHGMAEVKIEVLSRPS